MIKKIFVICILIIFVLSVIACSSLRFSQLAPEAKDFHPQRIVIFPADAVNYEEAKGVVEKVVAGVLAEKKWFTNVIDAENLNRRILVNEELREVIKEYLSKLNTLDFSDPDLSRKIGELAKADAFLLVSVDAWNYAIEKDKKVAKVSLTMKLYEASSGKRIWKAGHDITESYILIKPHLSEVARNVTRDMVKEMPH
jgi:exo-beta-1,3-glucanase (GH17 family)